jgi:hypothetical protein
MKHYTEFELQQALADVAAGCPIRQVAREWGIPYQSLQHRLKGRQSRNAAWVDYQRLSQSQEANLAAYISTQEALGMPLTHQQVKGLAERMMGDTHRPLVLRPTGPYARGISTPFSAPIISYLPCRSRTHAIRLAYCRTDPVQLAYLQQNFFT